MAARAQVSIAVARYNAHMNESRLLILETSGRVGHVAVAHGACLLASGRLDDARRNARDLAPAVATLLAGAGWRPRDLDAVLVSRGPGSYTGLRVGIMSAKVLAYATGSALVGVDTFAALAHQAPANVDTLDVLADAQQGRVYVQRYRRQGEEWQAATALAIAPIEEWLRDRPADAWATGPGLRAVSADRVVTSEAWEPTPESVLHVGLRRYLEGQRDDVWAMEPLYARPSSAEEQWDKRSTNP